MNSAIKQAILKELQGKFPGVSDTILNRIAEKLSKTVTDDAGVKPAADGVTTQQLLESYGDSRATEAQQTAVTNYEKKYGLKNGVKQEIEPSNPKLQESKVNQETEPKGNISPEMQTWMKQMSDNITALSGAISGLQQERTAKSRKSMLNEILKDSPEEIKARYNKDFERLTFKDDNDFNDWIGGLKPDIEKINSGWKQSEGHVTPPMGSSSKTGEVNPMVKAHIERNSETEASPVIMGLQTNK